MEPATFRPFAYRDGSLRRMRSRRDPPRWYLIVYACFDAARSREHIRTHGCVCPSTFRTDFLRVFQIRPSLSICNGPVANTISGVCVERYLTYGNTYTLLSEGIPYSGPAPQFNLTSQMPTHYHSHMIIPEGNFSFQH